MNKNFIVLSISIVCLARGVLLLGDSEQNYFNRDFTEYREKLSTGQFA